MRKKAFIVLAVILATFVGLVIIVNRNVDNVVSDEIKTLIEKYVKKEYKIDCKIKSVSFSHYEEGIAGGLYRYEFVCLDKKFNKINISYSSYQNLNKNTLENLKIWAKI